eukprot:4083515-Prymnesium_polylepis.2
MRWAPFSRRGRCETITMRALRVARRRGGSRGNQRTCSEHGGGCARAQTLDSVRARHCIAERRAARVLHRRGERVPAATRGWAGWAVEPSTRHEGRA